MYRRCAILSAVAARSVAAEPVDTEPKPHETAPTVAVTAGEIERSDGSYAAGAGLSIGIATTGHYDAALRLERWNGVDGSTERTTSLRLHMIAKLPHSPHVRPYFFVDTGLERTSGGLGIREMEPAATALNSQIGFGTELVLTDQLRMFSEISYGSRVFATGGRADDDFATGLIGLRLAPAAKY